MSFEAKVMYTVRCDAPGGCSAELDADDGAWLYDTADQAREAAKDYDWVTGVLGNHYCDQHRHLVQSEKAADHHAEAPSDWHYCPIHGDLLSGPRSPRCSEAHAGHEYLTRRPVVDDAAVLRFLNALHPHVASPNLSDWGKAFVAENRAALRAAFEVEA